MTRAPESVAQTMPDATFELDPEPLSPSTLTDIRLHRPQIPAIPVPLSVLAAAMPATWVP